MKKIFYILIGVGLAISILVVVGLAFAQTANPETPADADGVVWGGRGRWAENSCIRPLLGYLMPAMGNAFGLSEDEVGVLQEAHTLMQDTFADLDPAEWQAGVQAAFREAIAAALLEGAITQDQADRLNTRFETMGGQVLGRGFRGQGLCALLQGTRRGLASSLMFGDQVALHQYWESALAEAMGISLDELQVLKVDGLNLKDYAADQGWSNDELKDFLAQVLIDAVDAAVDEGAITQEQADQILEQMDTSEDSGFWPGFAGPRRRWQSGE